MKGLSSLIKMHQWQLDEKRRKLHDLQLMEDELVLSIQRIEEELKQEQQAASSDIEARFAYGNYAQHYLMRKENLLQSLVEVRIQVDAARDEVAEAFQELKKYELTKENLEKRQKAKEAQLEQAELDEIGLQGHVRKMT